MRRLVPNVPSSLLAYTDLKVPWQCLNMSGSTTKYSIFSNIELLRNHICLEDRSQAEVPFKDLSWVWSLWCTCNVLADIEPASSDYQRLHLPSLILDIGISGIMDHSGIPQHWIWIDSWVQHERHEKWHYCLNKTISKESGVLCSVLAMGLYLAGQLPSLEKPVNIQAAYSSLKILPSETSYNL